MRPLDLSLNRPQLQVARWVAPLAEVPRQAVAHRDGALGVVHHVPGGHHIAELLLLKCNKAGCNYAMGVVRSGVRS